MGPLAGIASTAAGRAWWWGRYIGPAGPGVAPSAAAPPGPAAPFPQSPLPIAVDLYMFGNWVDVTRLEGAVSGVYSRDAITITRGRSPEGTVTDPTGIGLTLNHRDGRYSPRNPNSILYGQIGRNTPLRVRVGNDVQAVGEVPSWPQKWDTTGTDVWVPVDAAGILRRLGQGSTPLKSVMRRSALDVLPNVVAYWPVEDADGSTQIASGHPDSRPMTVTGTPDWATATTIPSSAPFAATAGSRWRGQVPTYTPFSSGITTNQTVLRFLLTTTGSITNGCVMFRIATGGGVARHDLVYSTAAGGSVTVNMYDAAGTLLDSDGPLDIDLDTGRFWVFIGLDNQFGLAGTFVDIYPLGASLSDPALTLSASAAATVTAVTAVEVAPSQNGAGLAISHITVQATSAGQLFNSTQIAIANGHVGEAAGERISRLCDEEGITFETPGGVDLSDSSPLGAQRPETLLTLLQEAADTDGGILYEPKTVLGLAYRTRASLLNREPSITLDYAAHQMRALEPVDDDQQTRNYITATRTGGSSSAPQILESGPLSVLPPPDGVGKYDEEVTVNVETDAVLDDHAGWRLHLGTVDEARYPNITMMLAAPAFVADPALSQAVRDIDVGQRLDVVNPPSWLPPDDITQGVQGYTQTLSQYEWTVTANLTPESPWRVAVYDDTPGDSYHSDGSSLAADAAAADTALSVATPSGPLWSTDAGDYPIDMRVAGERVTVTAVAGAASPQAFTVTRAVNGISKAQLAGTEIDLWQPTIYTI